VEHRAASELLGVFALDACDDDEIAAIEGHLIDCPECAAEAAQLGQLAGWIGASQAEAPDLPLRERMLAEAFDHDVDGQ
jgi:anti-sigma factor RsiW